MPRCGSGSRWRGGRSAHGHVEGALVDLARGVPDVSDEYGDPWDYVDHAACLVVMAQDVVARAVVYAHEHGGTWTTIAEALDTTPKQTATSTPPPRTGGRTPSIGRGKGCGHEPGPERRAVAQEQLQCGEGGECIELAYLGAVRDSKNPTGSALRIDLTYLLAAVKRGRFDR